MQYVFGRNSVCCLCRQKKQLNLLIFRKLYGNKNTFLVSFFDEHRHRPKEEFINKSKEEQ